VLDLAEVTAEKALRNSLSDSGVAALFARACALGASYNVLINLKGLEPSDFTRETRARADSRVAEVEARAKRIETAVGAQLQSKGA